MLFVCVLCAVVSACPAYVCDVCCGCMVGLFCVVCFVWCVCFCLAVVCVFVL